MQTWFGINVGNGDLALDRVQLMLGYATDLFIDTTKAAREFGVRLASLDEDGRRCWQMLQYPDETNVSQFQTGEIS